MNRGFTLVELLATLILIGTISLMAFTSLNKQIKQTNEASYDKFIANIELATESYITGKSSDYPELKMQNNPVCINLKEVVLKGYISSKTKNPKTDTLITDSSLVVTLNTENKYVYLYSDNQLCTVS